MHHVTTHRLGALSALLALSSVGIAPAATALAPAGGRPATSSIPAGVSRAGTDDTLSTLFARSRHLPVTAVQGVRTDSLKEATDTATGAQWALAHFQASSARYALSFQDGGGIGVFDRPAGRAWAVSSATVANDCSSGLPAVVARAWGLDRPALCQTAAAVHAAVTQTATGVSGIAESQVGIVTNPEVTSFDQPDCNPYTTLVSSASSQGSCGHSTTVTFPSGRTESVDTQAEFWCSDFSKWVWEEGRQPDTGALDSNAGSFMSWGEDNGDSVRADATTPEVGDAIVLYHGTPDGESDLADHVGIITDVASNGDISTVNGDFQGGAKGVIGVYAWPSMSIASFADEAEGDSSEQWVLVTPKATSIPPSSASSSALRFAGYESMPGGLVLNAHSFGDPAEATLYAKTDGANEIASRYQLADGYVAYTMTYDAKTYCLNVKGSGTAERTELLMYSCSLGSIAPNEQFEQADDSASTYGHGTHWIVPAIAPEMCLNAKGGQVSNAEIILYACDDQSNEAWSDVKS